VVVNSIDADIVFPQEVQERNERMAHRPVITMARS
jgi:hypothetical protein